jgi:signal transduction histidine kinase
MENEIIKIIMIVTVLILALFLIIFVTLFTLFQKKKVDLLLEQKEKEKIFEETLKRSEIEIKENALKNISWELHDNVGQLLSLARLELNILKPKSVQNAEKISEISEIIGTSLQEIRTISKILNSEYINSIGLEESIKIEIDRFNRLKFIAATLEISGENFEIPNQDEIILFRMIQEFFSNTIKHAQATQLSVSLHFTEQQLEILVQDNGKGFELEKAVKGSGLLNMQSRAKMIQTQFELISDAKGTQIKMTYPNKNLIKNE